MRVKGLRKLPRDYAKPIQHPNIKKLLMARTKRRKNLTTEVIVLPHLLLGSLVASRAEKAELGISNKTWGLISLALVGLAGATMGLAAAELVSGSREVRKATESIGRGLGEDARHNVRLRQKLKQKKYLIINSTGELVLTDIPQIIPHLGRMRLSTEKILSGGYGATTKKPRIKGQ